MKRTIQLLTAVCLMGAVSIASFAQSRTVKGKVTDGNGEPVIGAAVMLQGTSKGTVTDAGGNFLLEGVPSAGKAALDISSLGFEATSVDLAKGQATVNVVLKEDTMMLDETVVVGYGTQKKVNLTGAISTVASKDLENRSAHNVTSMLQGAVPGLNITTSAGNPGATPDINIRGVTSINGASPMVMIDGAVGDLSRVNSEDVESISVIKDAAAAAIYGARAAYGVILVTTKQGKSENGKGASVRYNGRWGWEQPTTSTDYESRGYWSVYTVNKFWASDAGGQYIRYDDYDMQQLLARVNDKTEDPSRPWVVVTKNKSGQDSYKYYGNTDFYHLMFKDRHPVQMHNLSVSGGTDKVHYYVSGAYDRESGIYAQNPDVFNKFNLRAKVDFKVNKWLSFSNNTSFYSGKYSYIGGSDIEDAFAYGNSHGLACFVPQNPDGSWVYKTDWTDYAVCLGRHIVLGNNKNTSVERRDDFTNKTEFIITPVKGLQIVGNFTFRKRYNMNTKRKTNFYYSEGPGRESVFATGAGENVMTENVTNVNYYAANLFATYEHTWADAHHFTATAGANYETQNEKTVHVKAKNLVTDNLTDLDLVGVNEDGAVDLTASGGQTEYALIGYFARLNYDFKGRYLVEVSGRYDGTSRFAPGHRWGFFPSGSLGWRISEEPFFARAKRVVNNLKIRASYGSLGNQNVGNYAYMRTISLGTFDSYTFGESTGRAKYSSISSPNSEDLTWETSQQYNLGLDVALFKNRLNFTGEVYIRDTKNMLTSGDDLPSVYGATAPESNSADLRTKGYELSLSWRDGFTLLGREFNYFVKGSLSDYASYITRFNNPTKSFAKDYYEGMRLGDIWGFKTDGLFKTDAEAQAYAEEVDLGYVTKRLTGGWLAGDVKFLDLDGDGKLSLGQNTAYDSGDRTILGNSKASLQYGFNLGFDWVGIDISAFFQGVGTHYVYPHGQMMQFWGCYSRPYVSYLPTGFIDKVWSEDNPDSYFPRPRAYCASASGAYLNLINDRYLQNAAYLRLKNLTVGYTLPKKLTRKAKIDKVRFYFSGENLAYWSPMKKYCAYLDPEVFTKAGAAGRANLGYGDEERYYNAIYPWQASYMFGIDIVF